MSFIKNYMCSWNFQGKKKESAYRFIDEEFLFELFMEVCLYLAGTICVPTKCYFLKLASMMLRKKQRCKRNMIKSI